MSNLVQTCYWSDSKTNTRCKSLASSAYVTGLGGITVWFFCEEHRERMKCVKHYSIKGEPLHEVDLDTAYIIEVTES